MQARYPRNQALCRCHQAPGYASAGASPWFSAPPQCPYGPEGRTANCPRRHWPCRPGPGSSADDPGCHSRQRYAAGDAASNVCVHFVNAPVRVGFSCVQSVCSGPAITVPPRTRLYVGRMAGEADELVVHRSGEAGGAPVSSTGEESGRGRTRHDVPAKPIRRDLPCRRRWTTAGVLPPLPSAATSDTRLCAPFPGIRVRRRVASLLLHHPNSLEARGWGVHRTDRGARTLREFPVEHILRWVIGP